jgi:hypothetical protein
MLSDGYHYRCFRVFNGNLATPMMNNSTNNSLKDGERMHHVPACMERSHRVHGLIVVPGTHARVGRLDHQCLATAHDEPPRDSRQHDQFCAHQRELPKPRSRPRNPRPGATRQCTIEKFFPSARPPDTLLPISTHRPQDSLTQIPRATMR